MAHLHSFNLWNAETRTYDCPCGARLTEEVLEVKAPYGASIFRHRITELRELLFEVWKHWGEIGDPIELRRRVLNELAGVMPEDWRQEELAELDREEPER